jgi:hypothetical protein
MSMGNQTNLALQMIEDAFEKIETAPRVGEGDLAVLGGEFAVERLPDFMAKWSELLQTDLTWSMIETVSRFWVSQHGAGLVENWDNFVDTLERARFFGFSGDLELRRDEGRFLWHFTGDAGEKWLAALNSFEVRDFWKEHKEPKPQFVVLEKEYLQWRPGDERVSTKWVDPSSLVPNTRTLVQRHYLDRGQIVFVRYVAFK